MKQIQYKPVYIATFFMLLVSTIAVQGLNISMFWIPFYALFWGAIFAVGLFGGWSYRETKSQSILSVLSGIFVFLSDHVDQKLSIAKGGDQEVLLEGLRLPAKGWTVSILITVLAVFVYFLVPKPAPAGIGAFPSRGGWYETNDRWENTSKKDSGLEEGGSAAVREAWDESQYMGSKRI